MRTRLTYQRNPMALVLADTPSPTCLNCLGTGDCSETYAGPVELHPGIIDCRCWEPGWGWQLLPFPKRIGDTQRRRSRLRLRIASGHGPHDFTNGPTLVLTDSPRPTCAECRGEGGWEQDYGDHETGEYAGTEWVTCDCWQPRHFWHLIPLPHLRALRRRPRDGFSDEPPF
ncbi:hypothetical protein [Streptomyces sp. NPDC056308]|uniref:hypothetical protein n=1 Tax=unclassified Streptomyces TaxID=2593676 RepID=UPI0035DCA376